jgi:SAM-dependent methyltransferase
VTETALASQWTGLIAPASGDVRTELVQEAADFLGIPIGEAWDRLRGAGDRFRQEWLATVTNPQDDRALTDFYNRSDTELFELIEWHATDPIHYRTLVVRDRALARPGRAHLDYGSGIGNDALVFAAAGFQTTLADISECLLAFAAWRCRRRGYAVKTVDLKREAPPANTFDVVVCFDVLEHIPEPLRIVRTLRAALRERGVLVFHAPFADDPEHPMHVVHSDVITPRLRSMGFHPLEWEFPAPVRAPQVYEKRRTPLVQKAGYFLVDRYPSNPISTGLAGFYRRFLKRPDNSEFSIT